MYIYIYIYIYIYVCMYYLYYLNKTCSPGHYHNSFMATGALGNTHVRLHMTRDKQKMYIAAIYIDKMISTI